METCGDHHVAPPVLFGRCRTGQWRDRPASASPDLQFLRTASGGDGPAAHSGRERYRRSVTGADCRRPSSSSKSYPTAPRSQPRHHGPARTGHPRRCSAWHSPAGLAVGQAGLPLRLEREGPVQPATLPMPETLGIRVRDSLEVSSNRAPDAIPGKLRPDNEGPSAAPRWIIPLRAALRVSAIPPASRSADQSASSRESTTLRYAARVRSSTSIRKLRHMTPSCRGCGTTAGAGFSPTRGCQPGPTASAPAGSETYAAPRASSRMRCIAAPPSRAAGWGCSPQSPRCDPARGVRPAFIRSRNVHRQRALMNDAVRSDRPRSPPEGRCPERERTDPRAPDQAGAVLPRRPWADRPVHPTQAGAANLKSHMVEHSSSHSVVHRRTPDQPGGSAGGRAAKAVGRSPRGSRFVYSCRPAGVRVTPGPEPGDGWFPPRARSASSRASPGAPQAGPPIRMVRPFDSGAFGMWMRRTPFSRVAVIAFAETARGRVKERRKRARRRSRRW